MNVAAHPDQAHIVATAGHPGHGKTALVHALTTAHPHPMDPAASPSDGHLWTRLADGAPLALVDLPGGPEHTGTMLAGLCTSPAVLFVVAADQGWHHQSQDHLDMIDALRLSRGVLVVTRTDLAGPERTAQTLLDARARLAVTSLGIVETVTCSARTGDGIDDVHAALGRLGALTTPQRVDSRARLWIDHVDTAEGGATTVSGTLVGGVIRAGEALDLLHSTSGSGAHPTRHRVQIHRLRHHQITTHAQAPTRLSIDLAEAPPCLIHPGDTLLSPDTWRATDVLDVRPHTPVATLPEHGTLHLGSAAVPTRIHPGTGQHLRLQLDHPLPLTAGDHAVLCLNDATTGTARLLGLDVHDVAPPHRGPASTPPPTSEGPVLILGGTGEARALADALTALGQPFLSSLAGIVTDPILPVGDVRVGGFGGPTGLAQYLREHGVAAVVDATHPFAARMTAHAASACHAADVPLLRLQRPSWSTHPGAESWTWVDSHTEAGETAARLGHRIFLTTGRKTLSDFLAVPAMTTCEVLARLVEPPDLELPPTWRILRSRGPFSCADEIALLRKEQIDVLVTKDSGGPSTTAKLDAAAALRLPVIVVRRPPLPAGITQVAEVTDATAWVAQTTTH